MNKLVKQVQQDLLEQADDIKADFLPKFFTPEPGETDQFLGVTVPKQRLITKKYYKLLSPEDVVLLLQSPVHEERLTALMIWVLQFKVANEVQRKNIYDLYLKNTKWINNWDLVDTSARDIVGGYLFDRDKKILDTLSSSKNVWERRIAMIATFYFIQRGEFGWTLKLAEQYLDDTHHYIHKATGWMLREVGKRDKAVLRSFLDQFATRMPRVELRYAIEKFDEKTRRHYLALR